MPNFRESLGYAGLLDAEDLRIGFAHIREQLVFGKFLVDYGGSEPGVKAESVIEIEAERGNDGFGQHV